MKIAINTIPLLSPLTGVGNYTYQIIKSLQTIDSANDYAYFYGYYSRRLFTYQDRKSFYHLKELVRKVPFGGITTRRLKDIVNNLFYKNFDLYFEPNFIPIAIKAKHTVTTIHDFSFRLYPEWHPKDRIFYFENNFWKSIKQADKIIVVSDFIFKESVNLFGLPKDKIKTIYNGFDRCIFRNYPLQDLQSIKDKYNLPDNFILCVGSLEPRKNLKNLILAFTRLDKEIRKGFKIVIAGFKGWKNKEIMKLIENTKTDIILLGYIKDVELGKLYNAATVFVYPSFYEGFGLPPLEAMACGCPVIVSHAASLPEVCGDAVYYVNPYDIDNIAGGIYKVLTDEILKKSLVAKGIERAKLFSWERSAREHLKVFQEVLNP
jgi:glycosyltransferase involved in cell wall biosynthesis